VVDNRPSFDLVLVPEDAHDVPGDHRGPQPLLGPRSATSRRSSRRRAIVRRSRTSCSVRDLDWERIVKIETHQFELPGVSVQVGPRRTYPFGQMAAHLLGYVGEVSQQERENRRGYHLGDLIGKAGAERYWEGLSARRRRRPAGRGRLGRPQARVLNEVDETPGNSLVLTIDRDLQQSAEQAMDGHDGSIVALDTRTGQILAMVSRPAFDPNVFARGIRLSNGRRSSTTRSVHSTARASRGRIRRARPTRS
jgi:penicillin-binding protein 2